jgi:hypothetical protein
MRQASRFRRGSGDSMLARRPAQHGKPPSVAARDRQRDAREGQARPAGVAERPVRVKRPGNAGGAKGPQFKDNATSGAEPGDWR